mgnify:CR=1 FL=1
MERVLVLQIMTFAIYAIITPTKYADDAYYKDSDV